MDVQIDVNADTISKSYWKNNRRFAAIINAVLFHGKNLICEKDISQWDSEETTVLENQNSIIGKERRRDLMRKVTVLGTNILIGLENQQYKDKSMPLRDMEYTLMNYVNQTINKRSIYKAVFTIVLYYGKENWKDNHAISDLVELPDELIEQFNNWKAIIIDVKTFDCKLIDDPEVRDCFQAIQRIHKWKGHNDIFKELTLNKETALFVSVVTKCKELEKIVRKYKEEEEINMCTSFDMVLDKERNKTREQERTNFVKKLEKERDKSKIEILITLIRKKFGLISQEMITMLNQANDVQLDQILMEIFNIHNEEDIKKILS